MVVTYLTSMRAAPTVTQSNTAIYNNSAIAAVTSLGTVYPGPNSLSVNVNVGSGLTSGNGGVWLANRNSAGYIDLSAEL